MTKNNRQYVYKYVDGSGTVVYVGITNNICKRIAEHKYDKLSVLKKPTIMYFPVKYRQDAEMLETYLINHYGTGKHFNVKKKDRGDVSFLGECDDLPWIVFDGDVDSSATPFSLDSFVKREVVTEEVVREVPVIKYIDEPKNDEEAMAKFWKEQAEILDYLKNESNEETKIINALKLVLVEDGQYEKNKRVSDKDIRIGISLHLERLSVIEGMTSFFGLSPIERNRSTIDELLKRAVIVNSKIESHEKSMVVRNEYRIANPSC